MSHRITKGALASALGLIAPATVSVAQELPPPRPTVIGINVAEVRYYGSTLPFANLVVGSEWHDSRWRKLPAEYQDRNGDLRSLPDDGMVTRFLLVPPTGPKGFEVRCTFTGSGTLDVVGSAGDRQAGPNSLRFRLVNEQGKQATPWLTLKDVDLKRPPRNLDCRDASLDGSVRFRPEFLKTLHDYGVIRFMDWQNANANEAVAWADRHTPASIDLDRDGVSIEDMIALTNELGAAPWFVMPWNASNEYITKFAQMVRARLPANQAVYVEVGNEIWNTGFAASKQAIKEGMARKLGTDEHEAGMRRYAERTVEVMRLWEAAFTGRKGLVRVLSTQHAWPQTAETALSFRDTATHVDAVATAPYFGSVHGGTDNTREASLQQLRTELTATLNAVTENRRIVVAHGKRYIGYEGGQGLVLPAQQPLADQMQHDPAMYDLYQQYLAGWQQRAGDLLCLYNSVSKPTSWGNWGLSAREDETPAEAPKRRAVTDFIHNSQRNGTTPAP